MNINEEIEMFKNANKLRDEIKVVEEHICEIECELDTQNPVADFMTHNPQCDELECDLHTQKEDLMLHFLLDTQKEELKLMKSEHKTILQEINERLSTPAYSYFFIENEEKREK